jgi:hypothetical protein
MTRKRYKAQGTGSFFGEYLSERTVRDSLSWPKSAIRSGNSRSAGMTPLGEP